MLSYVDNGRVDVYYGSAGGLPCLTVPSVFSQGMGAALYGAGMDQGDFNNDGIVVVV